jgi:membrane protease YdiL (CAAX protease family)
MIISLLLYALMLLLAVVGAGKFKGRKWLVKKLGFKEVPVFKGFTTAVFYFLILFALTVVITSAISYAGYGEDAGKVSFIIGQISIWEVLIVLTVASFVEEIFFRGFLQVKTNLWIAAAIFALFHVTYGSVTEVLGTFVLGAVLGYEFKRTKSLFSPILTHLIYNLVVVILIFTTV